MYHDFFTKKEGSTYKKEGSTYISLSLKKKVFSILRRKNIPS